MQTYLRFISIFKQIDLLLLVSVLSLIQWFFEIRFIQELSIIFLIIVGVLYIKNKNIFDINLEGDKDSRANIKYGSIYLFLSVLVLFIITLNLIARLHIGEFRLIDSRSDVYYDDDNAIFVQVATSIANGKGFYTTYSVLGYPNSFLADHFSPILIIPAILIKLGMWAPISMIINQYLFMFFSIFLIRRIAILKGFDAGLASFIAFLFISFTPIRQQMLCGPQIEFLAVPFCFLAWERYLSHKPWQSVLACFGAMMCKETLFLWALFWGISILLLNFINNPNRFKFSFYNFFRQNLAFFILIIVSFVAFVAYVLCHKYIFNLNYYHWILAFSVVFYKPYIFLKKVWYFFSFLGLVLFLPLLNIKRLIYILNVFPFFIISLVFFYPHVYELNRHYAVFPMACVFVGTLVSLNINDLKKYDLRKIGLILVLLHFSIVPLRSNWDVFYSSFTKNHIDYKTLRHIVNLIGDDIRAAASASAAVFLADKPNIFLINTIKSGALNSIRYGIWYKKDREFEKYKVSSFVQLKCYETQDFIFYCNSPQWFINKLKPLNTVNNTL